MILTGGVVFAVFIVLLAFTLAYFEHTQAENEWKKNIKNLSLSISAHANQSFFSSTVLLQSITDEINGNRFADEAGFKASMAERSFHENLQKKINSNPLIDVAIVTDKNGESHNDDSVFYGEPVFNNFGKWSFYMSQRINDTSGRFLGVVLIESEALTGRFKASETDNDASIRGFSDSSVFITSPDDSIRSSATKRRMIALSKVSDYPFYIEVSFGSDIYLDAYYRLLTPIFAIAFFANCLLFFTIKVFLKKDAQITNNYYHRALIQYELLQTKEQIEKQNKDLEIKLDDFIANTMVMVQDRAEKEQVELTVNIQTEILCHADKTKLRQVLINLLANAIKYTPAGGRVTVEVTATDLWMEFAVIDTGIGMSEAELEEVFEQFKQIDNFHNRINQGTA
eukprot:gene3208-3251_t